MTLPASTSQLSLSSSDLGAETSNGAASGPGQGATQAGNSALHVYVLTLFPEFFASPLQASILKRAAVSGALEFSLHDIREYTKDRHRTADDTPYGGGAGMVMKPEPISECIEAVQARVESLHGKRPHRILMTPQGRPLDQETVRRLAQQDHLMLICGRYEGIDARVCDLFVDEELSIGDYVLSGGEPAALIVLDAITRLRPGVLGNAESSVHESFSEHLLEYPQYTRPLTFRGRAVPEILTSGDHARIARWRREQSLLRTLERRPDLFLRVVPSLSALDRAFLAEHAKEAWQKLQLHIDTPPITRSPADRTSL